MSKLRARIIYNPSSGRETIKNELASILNVYEQAGYETSAFATTPELNSAKNEARRVALEGFDLIVAAGGDGTVNEVVNGIADLDKRPTMAVIPAGTTNDYAHALGISKGSFLESAKVINKHQTVKMDIGQANQKYFMNIAGGGLLTELTYGVPADMKTIFGYLAYVAKGVELLPQIKPINMKIEYDEGVFEGKASMFLLGLTNSIAGFDQLVPNSLLDDGKFSLLVIKTANVTQILKLAAMALNGSKHVNDNNVIYTRTSHVKISVPDGENIKINLDGEYGSDTPVDFIDHKQHIKMVVDMDSIKSTHITDRKLI